jgi:2-iminobutanoate/2-iminopropanoate deaminase
MTHKVHDISVAKQIGRYSDAIAVGSNMRRLMTSGTPGLSASGLPDDLDAQSRLAWESVVSLLAKDGMNVTDIVKVTQYLTRTKDIKAYAAVRTRFLGDHRLPSMLLVIPKLVWPGLLVEGRDRRRRGAVNRLPEL